jgi:hypothetical protein
MFLFNVSDFCFSLHGIPCQTILDINGIPREIIKDRNGIP